MKYLLTIIFTFLLSFYSVGQQNIDVQHYKFEIEVSDISDVINGKATITVRFLADASQVKFDLASVEDDKGMYAFQVKENKQPVTSHQANDVLAIDLLSVVKKGDLRTLEISYMGTPKDGLIISKNKFGNRTFFADNWPNRAHNWIPCHDAPNDKASFEFIVTAPSHYQVISNGIKADEKSLGGNKKQTHWKEQTALSTKVMVIGIAKFAVKYFTDSPVSVPVSAWVYPQDSTKGFYDYGVAPAIVKFFSNYIAPFPYSKLANVQSKTIFGGMENASCIFYAEESVTGNRKWEDVIAHEIVHQWFGDMASEESFAHLWLSEGFATYLTDIYIENKYGKDSASKRLQKEREKVIRFTKTSAHPVVDSTDNLMSLLNANSYEKGSWVLHMLRNVVGDSIFHNIIQSYYQHYKGSNANTRDFEKIAEQASGKNLKWFFDQWLYRPGIPQLFIGKKIDKDEVKLRITQQGAKFEFPLEIAIARADGSSLKQTIFVRDQITEYKIKVPGVKSVIIDPDVKLLYKLKE